MSTNEIRERAKGWRFWLVRPTVLGMCADLDMAELNLDAYRQRLAQTEAKLELIQQDHDALKAKHATAIKGTGAILGFVQQMHHLTPK